MSNCTELLSRLDRVRKVGPDRWIARCPAHDDRSPSLSVAHRPHNDQVLIHCFSGCTPEDILAAIGLDFGALQPEDDAPIAKRQRPVAVNRYRLRQYALDFVQITSQMVNEEGYEPTDADIEQCKIFADFLSGRLRSLEELRERVAHAGGRLPT